MKTKVLALGAVVTAFTFTSFAAEPLLSPRAAGNQIKTVSSQAPSETIAIQYVATSPALLSPRAQGNQLKVVQGSLNEQNPVLACRQKMPGTPRAIAECTSHANMPACQTVTAMK